MTRLTTFAADARAVVIGASGGIGDALARQLAHDPGIGDVVTLARSAGRDHCDQSIDLTNEASIARAAEAASADGPVDLVIVATGILHEGDAVSPEKRMQDLDGDAMARVFAVNAIGPALVAKHFLPHMRSGVKTVFAALSARVGSIADNRLGGWASYRASKAALNMLIRTLAIEQARKRPESVLLALHPGTVDTALSAPFRGSVPDEQLFTPRHAAGRLLAVIDDRDATDSGGFFAWDGSRIEY